MHHAKELHTDNTVVAQHATTTSSSMPAMTSPAEVVRKALATPSSCSATTSATLQSLLTPAHDSNAKPTKPPARTTTTRKAAPTRAATKKIPVNAPADATKALSPQERYKLATEVVNVSLKVLTDATKARRPSPPSSPSSKKSASSGLTVVAECARLAFSHLRAARALSDASLQLELGMLALSSKLVALGMDSLAMKELRILRGLLHKLAGVNPPSASDKETLATLLHLECQTSDINIISLAVSYHLTVLRLVANSRWPATVEASVHHLLLDNDLSPASLILRFVELSQDKTKAAKQLDSLSHLLLSMCPSPSASMDQIAQDHKMHASPYVAFKLQTTALLIQTKWWSLAGHKANLEKELHEPLIRYLDAYRRRASAVDPQSYKLAIDYVGKLVTLDARADASSVLPFSLYKSLSLFAESFGMYDEALKFTESMSSSPVHPSSESSSRRLLCTLRCLGLQLDQGNLPNTASFRDQMESCKSEHKSTAKELPSLFDELLVELVKLRKAAVKRITHESGNQSGSDMTESLSELCDIALLCTDVLVWYFECITRDMASKSVAIKLIVQFVSSNLFICKLLISTSSNLFETTRKALQACRFLMNLETNPEAQRLFVSISNLYWRCFQTLVSESDDPSPQAIQCLQASIDVLRECSAVHQEAGFLTTKLEKLGSISDSCTSFAESVRIQLRSGILHELTQDAIHKPLSMAFELRPKAQILKRNLHEYHLASAKNAGNASFFDDTSLDALERATLLEIQLSFFEEELFKPSHRRKITIDLQKLCGLLLDFYTEDTHPLRRARVCARILRYSNEYRDVIDKPTVERALATTVSPGSLDLDSGLQSYASYLEISLSLAQALHAEKPRADSVEEHVQKLSSLINSLDTCELLTNRVDDIDILISELQFAASFLSMKGKDNSSLKALRTLSHVHSLWAGVQSSSALQTLAQLALQYLHLGYSLEACRVLEQGEPISTKIDTSTLAKLEWHLARTETWTFLGQTDFATKSMASAADCMRSFPSVNDAMKTQAQMVRARFAFVCSLYSRSIGQVKQAMIYAKRYVLMIQQTLAFLERQHAPQSGLQASPASNPQEELAKAIGNLVISDPSTGAASNVRPATVRGAAFSIIVPDLLRSFLHMSEMYAHQGMRVEASYYLEQADKLVMQLDVPELRTKILVQREAQAHIEGIESVETVNEDDIGDSIDLVRLGITRGDIYAADESTWDKAQQEYEKAEFMAVRLANESFNENPKVSRTQADNVAVTKIAPIRNTKRTTVKAPASKMRPAKTAKPTLVRSKSVASTTVPIKENIPFSSLCAAALRQRGLLLMNQGETDLGLEMLERADAMKYDSTQQVLQHLAMAEGLLQKFGDELALDFTFNVLPESTISFPALSTATSKKQPAQSLLSSTPLAAANTNTPKKSSRQKRTDDEFARFLCEAQERIVTVQRRSASTAGISVFHQMCGLGTKTMLLLSAIDASMSSFGVLHPTRAACSIEMSRIEAFSRELGTIEAEKGYSTQDLAVQLPIQDFGGHLSASRFQKEYIDIIPSCWTAVSLTLSEDQNELYIVRYRAKQPPFLLRLPMTRNKLQDLEEDEESASFDFASGKSELQEIIELSNYSCSKPPSAMTKEARESWWDEREALDLRMQELIVNIENIWLGGFKGILSQHRKDSALLARFRKSFEGILDRHLPSRQGAKGRAKKLVLDSNILELFVGLGDDQDGEVDMDEQVLDLLYFVIDILQFNGERNAYDEVDFDVIATETMDTLRSYHEAASVSQVDQNHLVLILDRKLHAFPWESLPCLQGVSVSRVGSMLSLRERILAMRRLMKEGSEEEHFVSKQSGATILNPSGDLSRTQATMGPLLDSMTKTDGSTWQAITNRVPTEKDFVGALSEKNMLLYFGHGSGNQYIRDRTVKKLDKCAEVVWLMGCSSGKVTEYGDYEPTSVPLSYLVAGKRPDETADEEEKKQANDDREGLCMAVVATLWDVTDKDIDRFSVKLGEEWGLWQSTPTIVVNDALAPPKTPRKRGRSVPKTPSKTPSKTPPRNAGRSRSRLVMRDEEADRKKSLVEAVAKSRDACNLRYLNGAAPVVYGVPVYLGD